MASESDSFKDANLAQATVETAATSASFKLTAPTTVPNDNSPQKVPVTTATLTATLEYATLLDQTGNATAALRAPPLIAPEWLAIERRQRIDNTGLQTKQITLDQIGIHFTLLMKMGWKTSPLTHPTAPCRSDVETKKSHVNS